MKTKRTLNWWGKDFETWEPLVKPGTTVIWRGANGIEYRALVLSYFGGNMKLRFEDGHESDPCYIERLVGIETDTEIITIIGHDKPFAR